MTNKEMFEKSFQRPKNYFSLCAREQWNIDASLGILDWDGVGLTADERHRYNAHYGFGPKKKDSKLDKVDNTLEK